MNPGATTTLLITALLTSALPASGQAPREDLIWARVASGPITLDGVLDEPSWAMAESKSIYFREDNGIPGSGFKFEGGKVPIDSTRATLKFLVVGNQLYMGAVVPDASIGGSTIFNRFDGFLMSLKNHTNSLQTNKPPAEYFYAWWQPDTSAADPQPTGQEPHFMGQWAELPWGVAPRTPEQIAAWDAVTVVNGLSNSDTTLDVGYTVEMRFNLTPMGYDVTQAGGDVLEWNISIYDCDWFWPIDVTKFSANRVWWQGPWGNQAWYNEVRIHARPDVTVSSGPVPDVGPEVTIPETTDPDPVIDGDLSDTVWSSGTPYSFEITYGDTVLRASYEGIGPHRSGQYLVSLYDTAAVAVLDPGDATVQIVTKGDYLYFGFDVRDLVVQYDPDVNRWDGFLITISDRGARGPDQELLGRRISFQVAADGSALPQDYLNTLVTAGDAQVAIALGPGTTVDTLGLSADAGYTAELAIDLTALGYPPGLGDGALFLGVNLLDGDSFTPYTDSYGTRTWWYREYEGECCPVWAHLQKGEPIGIELVQKPTAGFVLAGSFPNPARVQNIQYSLPEPSRVILHIFDVGGRLVSEKKLGLQDPGTQIARFDGRSLGGGLYFFRLTMVNPETDDMQARLTGRMLLLK
jgi:hypothetical protein